jgi:hypothetical protein
MSNPLIPRDRVHAWSESIGEDQAKHQSAIQRLVREQRRLSRFVEENAKGMKSGATGGVAVYLIGVILRMFDLSGGRMRNVTWEDVREAEKRVGGMVDLLLPVDDGLVARARAVPRAQAHILDEALYALFERDKDQKKEEETPLDDAESLKIYLLMWVAAEALDKNWTPPKDFDGPTDYVFTAIA